MTRSTFKRGDDFESEVYVQFNNLLADGKLSLTPEHCKIFRKKGYYSRDAESNIVFDLSIECTFPGDTAVSIYLFIECKDYSGTIPRSDIEEFKGKVEQVSGLNCKAIFVTTAALQSSALNFARNRSIRVMRKLNDGTFETLVHYVNGFEKTNVLVNNNVSNALSFLTSECPISGNTIMGIGPSKAYFSFVDLFEDAIAI